ncbi:MAG: hypothetical protein KGI19_09600 [Thaumarchaeota archaeon]|nr:hypothetical protein [Nitrososphaerota archaeon]
MMIETKKPIGSTCACPLNKRITAENGEVACSVCGQVLCVASESISESTNSLVEQLGTDFLAAGKHLGSVISQNDATGKKAILSAQKRLSNNIHTKYTAKSLGESKYSMYVKDRLNHLLKNRNDLSDHQQYLACEILNDLKIYLKIKRKSGEKITSIVSEEVRSGRTIRHVRYTGIDTLIKETVINYCLRVPALKSIVKIDSMELHTRRISTNKGPKLGSKRPKYAGRYSGLKDLVCMKHGHFNEKSFRDHHIKVHIPEGEHFSYETFLNIHCGGYQEYKLQLKLEKKKNFATTGQKSGFSQISICNKCGSTKTRRKFGEELVSNRVNEVIFCSYCENEKIIRTTCADCKSELRLKIKNVTYKKVDGVKKEYAPYAYWYHIIKFEGKIFSRITCPMNENKQTSMGDP